MKIYTRFGDCGQTQLLQGIKLSKADDRIQLIGSLDELNSALGVALSHTLIGDSQLDVQRIQAELFECGALVAAARVHNQTPAGGEAVRRLEDEIDHWQDELAPMTHFILPGGGACCGSTPFREDDLSSG